jgi:hypothetical protein
MADIAAVIKYNERGLPFDRGDAVSKLGSLPAVKKAVRISE